MTIEAYLQQLRARRRMLGCPWWDVRVCCSPWWHRRYWFYAGEGRFHCEICERIAV